MGRGVLITQCIIHKSIIIIFNHFNLFCGITTITILVITHKILMEFNYVNKNYYYLLLLYLKKISRGLGDRLKILYH
jgi:hypothetical protein